MACFEFCCRPGFDISIVQWTHSSFLNWDFWWLGLRSLTDALSRYQHSPHNELSAVHVDLGFTHACTSPGHFYFGDYIVFQVTFSYVFLKSCAYAALGAFRVSTIVHYLNFPYIFIWCFRYERIFLKRKCKLPLCLVMILLPGEFLF